MKFATAFAAAIVAVSFAAAVPASAAEHGKHHHKVTKKYTHKRSPRVAGWLSRGGYVHGDQNVPFVYSERRNPDSTHFDNRFFGERVIEGPYNSSR